MGPGRRACRWLLPLAVLAAAPALTPASAGAAPSRLDGDRAQRETRRALSRAGYTPTRVTCRRRGRAWSCRWSGVRRARPELRCSGSASVRRARRGRVATRIRRGGCQRPDRRPLPTLGFSEDQTPESVRLQRGLGVTVRRMFVGWNVVQPVPGVWDWSQADAGYKLLRANGLRPLIVATAAPCWANLAVPCSNTNHFPPDRAHDGAWKEFVRRLVARYPEAFAVEVWNEPNFLPYFAPRVDPARYAELLRHAFSAVKAVDPRMPVVSGGLVGTPVSGPYGMADEEFVAEMHRAGAGESFDALGVHPYPYALDPQMNVRYDPGVAALTVARVRAAHTRAGGRPVALWATETGIATTVAADDPPRVGEDVQAAGLMAMIAAFRSAGDVPVVVIHRLIDGATSGLTGALPYGTFFSLDEGVGSTFGVFREDSMPKPAACRISRAFGGSLAC